MDKYKSQKRLKNQMIQDKIQNKPDKKKPFNKKNSSKFALFPPL